LNIRTPSASKYSFRAKRTDTLSGYSAFKKNLNDVIRSNFISTFSTNISFLRNFIPGFFHLAIANMSSDTSYPVIFSYWEAINEVILHVPHAKSSIAAFFSVIYLFK
jgi:hypothetical protein